MLTISLSTRRIVDSLLASSAIENRDANSPMSALLTSDNIPALCRLAAIAFGHVAMQLNRTGRVAALSVPSDPSGESDQIMTIDLDVADPSISQAAIISHIENAVTFRLLALCGNSDRTLALGFASLADDFTSTITALITGRATNHPRCATLHPHWH